MNANNEFLKFGNRYIRKSIITFIEMDRKTVDTFVVTLNTNINDAFFTEYYKTEKEARDRVDDIMFSSEN